MKEFGKILKDLREEKGMKQLDLAQILQIKRTTLSMWETGSTEPNQDMLIQLTKIFDVTADYLLGLENK